MNKYCINLKKRKNNPYCKLLNKEITFSLCRECDNKEYKKISADLCRKTQCSAEIKRKKPTSDKKSLVTSGLQSGQQKSNNNQMRKHSQTLTKKQQKPAKMQSKSNKLASLERNRYSVFSNDTKRCYLCGSTYKLTWHEIYSGKNRQKSMKNGLCLRLCLNCHSKEQEDSQFNDYWHKQGQLYWEENIGSREEFIKAFRRNYLE